MKRATTPAADAAGASRDMVGVQLSTCFLLVLVLLLVMIPPPERGGSSDHPILPTRKCKYSLLQSLVYCRTRTIIEFCLVWSAMHLPCHASVAQKFEVWKRSTEAWKRESTKIRPPCIRPIDTRIHTAGSTRKSCRRAITIVTTAITHFCIYLYLALRSLTLPLALSERY